MTIRDGSSWVRLIGIGDAHLAILREEATDWLVTKADEPPIDGDGDKGDELSPIAALGRHVSRLRRGKVRVPEPAVRELIARETTETQDLDSVKEEYDRLLGENQAWVALLAYFDRTAQAGAEEGSRE